MTRNALVLCLVAATSCTGRGSNPVDTDLAGGETDPTSPDDDDDDDDTDPGNTDTDDSAEIGDANTDVRATTTKLPHGRQLELPT